MNYCCSCNDVVGYRFHPTDKELIDHYLWNKALDRDSAVQAIGEVAGNLCDWEPGELSRFSVRRSNDKTWYLFSRRNHCKRGVKRKTKLGYWKLTGKHRSIKANVGVGTKKTLVFYEGRVPKGKWTPWVIHEYTLPDTLPNQKGFFLCKLKRKDDLKAGISSGEEGQPSNVAYDKNYDSSSDINVDELLAQLGETNGSSEVEEGVASAQNPEMYREQVPSCNAASFLCNPTDGFDGVQNQSSTNEQNDEYSLVSSAHNPQMYGEQVPSCNAASFLCNPTDDFDFDGVQNQSSTNEQNDEFSLVSSAHNPQMYGEQVPSCNAASFLCNPTDDFDGVQNQSSTYEQNYEVSLVSYAQQSQMQKETVPSTLQSQIHKEHLPSTLESQMHEDQVPYFDCFSFLRGSNGNSGEIQHQSSTNEQDDGLQHQSSTNEQDDEFWNSIFVSEDEAYTD